MITYNNKHFTTRTFVMHSDESGAVEYIIAGDELQSALIGMNGEPRNKEARDIDDTIYHYVPNIDDDPSKICAEDLDIPFTFISEIE